MGPWPAATTTWPSGCFRQEPNPPFGDLVKILEENEHLNDTAMCGHKWWILPEEVLRERQVDISLWRNMDQKENQTSHEMEILQGIKATAESLSVTQRKSHRGHCVSSNNEESC